MIQAIATYFDGQSSIPQKLDIFFDEKSGLFIYQLPNDEKQVLLVKETIFDYQGQKLNIRIEASSMKYFKIQDSNFVSILNDYVKNNVRKNWYQQLISLNTKFHVGIAIFILCLIASIYVYILPWVAEKSVAIIPEEYDEKLGMNFYTEYCELNTVDTFKTKEVNIFARELALNNTKNIKLTVIESELINAFALPDGNVIIFTGILNKMKNHEELVGLMGHEVEHINKRHSMKMMCRNLSGYIFVSAILSDVNGIMAIIGDNVQNIQSLSFSRQFEREADLGAYSIMIQNNVHPRGIIQLFKHLESDDKSILPEFLSTHPITKERLNMIENLIQSKSIKMNENLRLKEIFKNIKQGQTSI